MTARANQLSRWIKKIFQNEYGVSSTTSQNNSGAKYLRRLLGVGILISAVLVVGCISVSTGGGNGDGAVEKNQKHTFVVGDNPTITVYGFNGSIEIITGPDGEVDVEAELTNPSRVSYSASVSGNTVTVRATKIGSGITIGRSPQAEIHLTVPAQSTINAQTGNGHIIVEGIFGDGELEAANGKVTVIGSDGKYTVSTANGSVKMSNVSGQFNARTTNGKIEFSGAMAPGSDNRFTTVNGSISVVFHSDPDIALDARTVNGRVKSARPILATTTEKKHLSGTYGGGSANLNLKTVNGSIDIR